MPSMAAIAAERAPRLVERIKIETRWLLLTTADNVSDDAATTRRTFIAQWPAIRNARLPTDDIARRFYDIAGEQAATLARLITARRNKKGG